MAVTIENSGTQAGFTVTSLVNSTYRWIAGGGGTGEFYVELLGGGDPSLAKPDFVEENGAIIPEETVDSLSASSWDYGDSDTLGFSTVYVRLSDDADPDSKADDYVQHQALAEATLAQDGDAKVFVLMVDTANMELGGSSFADDADELELKVYLKVLTG
ncbi:hypothetical protein LCGC14_2404320, partial [marine sediment metagenome]